MKNRVLFVDDEQAVLDAIQRHHRRQYDIVTACGCDEGLAAVQDQGPFEVVVTDFQMPRMNGTQFLEKAREIDSEFVPIMLTGQADFTAAIDAVNRGQIFRFLSKPCSPEVLRAAVDAGIEQLRLRNAERELLDKTVRGSVEVLSEVLAVSNPTAFGRGMRIRDLIRHITSSLSLADAWQYETAALLSQIGCVAIPDELMKRVARDDDLRDDEREMFAGHAEFARDLLCRIPRLQVVSEMIRHQLPVTDESPDPVVVKGGRMIAAALEFERRISSGEEPAAVVESMRSSPHGYDGPMLDALLDADLPTDFGLERVVPILDLKVGMVIDDDVRNQGGSLVVGSGHEITASSLRRLRNYCELGCLENVEVRVRSIKEPVASV